MGFGSQGLVNGGAMPCLRYGARAARDLVFSPATGIVGRVKSVTWSVPLLGWAKRLAAIFLIVIDLFWF